MSRLKQSCTFGQLVERYKLEELPDRPQTAASYGSLIVHLNARWQDIELKVMLKDLMAIQTWLSELHSSPTNGRAIRPLSKKTKQHTKALLHRIIECAMRWGVLPIGRNPISLIEIKVRGIQPKKRLKVPLTVPQIHKLIADPEMEEHVRVMSKVSIGLGLRISEVLGLRWEDVDWEQRTVSIERSSVGSHLSDTKSEASCSILPLSDYIVGTLQAWQEHMPSVKGWIFGSTVTGRPFHRDSLMASHLIPAGKRCGIHGLGWHTFRHTHIDLLRKAGVASETQMMLMRHADMRTTNAYGRDGGSLELKRPANQAVVDSLFQLAS